MAEQNLEKTWTKGNNPLCPIFILSSDLKFPKGRKAKPQFSRCGTPFLPSKVITLGGVQMPRSEVSKSKKKVVSAEVNAEVAEELNAKAKRERRTRSDLVRDAITRYLYYKA